MDVKEFLDNTEKRWAIVSQLSIIGEATNRLSNEFKDSNPEIPWREIAAMRNRLIHGYDQINWKLVWETIQRDLPPLKQFIQQKGIR